MQNCARIADPFMIDHARANHDVEGVLEVGEGGNVGLLDVSQPALLSESNCLRGKIDTGISVWTAKALEDSAGSAAGIENCLRSPIRQFVAECLKNELMKRSVPPVCLFDPKHCFIFSRFHGVQHPPAKDL